MQGTLSEVPDGTSGLLKALLGDVPNSVQGIQRLRAAVLDCLLEGVELPGDASNALGQGVVDLSGPGGYAPP